MTDIVEFPPAPIDVTDIDAALAFGWMPDNVGGAEWAARKLAETYDELADIQARIEQYVTMVKTWAQGELHTGRGAYLVKRATFFEDALKRYALTLRDEAGVNRDGTPKLATVKLPSAVIKTRAGKAPHYEWEVLDEESLLKWCEDYAPEAVMRLVDIDKLGELRVVEHGDDDGQYSVVVNESGERVPGIGHRLVEAKPPTATVKLIQESDNNE